MLHKQPYAGCDQKPSRHCGNPAEDVPENRQVSELKT
jgi:hypothetical protein